MRFVELGLESCQIQRRRRREAGHLDGLPQIAARGSTHLAIDVTRGEV
ncbi:MAG: hypothetical protein RJB30_339 [Actinomycetota bacterium]